MPVKNNSQHPLLNPVLNLLIDPRPGKPGSGGKNRGHIAEERLPFCLAYLKETLPHLASQYGDDIFANRVIFKAKLLPKFNSPSSTPDDLFGEAQGAEYVTSTFDGHLFEIDQDKISLILTSITNPTVRQQVDISRLEQVEPYLPSSDYSDEEIETIWKQSEIFKGGYKGFSFWLIPFISSNSRSEVAKRALSIIKKNFEISNQDAMRLTPMLSWIPSSGSQSFTEKFHSKIKKYIDGKSPRFSVVTKEKNSLIALIASGVVSRIQPIAQFTSSMTPGEGAEPTPPTPPEISHMPTVAVIDGGLTARSYYNAVTDWPEDKLIPDGLANSRHGNQVSALIVDADGWNNNLNIPKVPCRLIPIQCLPVNQKNSPDDDIFIEYIDHMMKSYPDVHIWNLSCNQDCECSQHQLSHIGSELGKISRENNKLLVISAGNINRDETRISPPADCESALVVGGREYDDNGNVAGQCPISRHGLGPAQLHKPEVSAFSRVRVIGGTIIPGTSYATPQISRIAAHTWANLKEPTPDLVRSLLINKSDLHDYCIGRGWGTPSTATPPWVCSNNEATLAWTSHIRSGIRYYWRNINIPPSMLDESNNLRGEIALTATLTPHMSELPIGNPIMSRLEVSLQKTTGGTNILGSCKTFCNCDSSLAKWNPIRVHKKEFSRTHIPGGKVALSARVYYRDRSRLTREIEEELSDIETTVTFALSFIGNSDETYTSFVQSMGNNVQSAIIEANIEVES